MGRPPMSRWRGPGRNLNLKDAHGVPCAPEGRAGREPAAARKPCAHSWEGAFLNGRTELLNVRPVIFSGLPPWWYNRLRTASLTRGCPDEVSPPMPESTLPPDGDDRALLYGVLALQLEF